MAWNTIISGVVGSHAYGLNTPTSDVDRLQFAAAPTEAFHGLSLPIGKAASQVQHEPDVTVHEAGKAVGLLLKANPTVTELLWLESYETLTELGRQLIDIRHLLLSATTVRNAYLGYATQQFHRIVNKGRFPDVPVSRIAKHARHLLRLVNQGTQLYKTGRLDVRVDNPHLYHAFGQRVADAAEKLDENPDGVNVIVGPVMFFAEHVFNEKVSALPEVPDTDVAEKWLLRVRKTYYKG